MGRFATREDEVDDLFRLLDFLKRRGVDSVDTAVIDLRPDTVRSPNSVQAAIAQQK